MRTLFITLSLLTIITAQDDRIIGGTAVEQGMYPWVAALIETGADSPIEGLFCTGNLINEEWVLTAAHCLIEVTHDELNEIGVIINNVNLENSTIDDLILIDNIIFHHNYINDQLEYDLALLHLTSPVTINPISVYSSTNSFINEDVITMGYGATDNTWEEIEQPSPLLMEIELTIFNNMICVFNGIFESPEPIGIYCVGIESNFDLGPCYGDSGGPLLLSTGLGYKFIGIVQGSNPGFCGSNFFSYTDITYFHDWIYSYVPLIGCTDDEAINFNPEATEDDGSCFYNCNGVGGLNLGDVNLDGEINVIDINAVIPVILTVWEAEQSHWCSADLNQDDQVNVLDIVAIVDIIMEGVVQSFDNDSPIYLSKTQSEIEPGFYELTIDIYNEQPLRAVQIELKAGSNRKFTSLNKSQNLDHFTFEHSISEDSTKAIILIFGLHAELIEAGLNSLFSIESYSSEADLNRSDDEAEGGEFSMVGFTNNGEEFLDYIEVTDLGKIYNNDDPFIFSSFKLDQVYPNPFNPRLLIDYSLLEKTLVTFSVYSIRGKKIETILSEMKDRGDYQFEWDAATLASGVYLLKMQTLEFTSVKKITLLK